MPTYSGTCTRTVAGGTTAESRPCRLDFTNESLTLIPSSSSPLSIDLGDIDELSPADYELHVRLYTGERITLARFGKSFQDLSRDLLDAHRKRLVQCLLLEDLEEVARFEGNAQLQSPAGGFSAYAEIRLYRSNLAVLPQAQVGFHWRLAEIDSVSFDDSCYAVVIRSRDEVLLLTRLAKRTRECLDQLQAAIAEVARRSALTVRSVFPFLTPDQFQRAAELMKDGRVASLADLAAIHANAAPALTRRIISAKLKPYYEFLAARAASCGVYAGFKLIRKEAESGSAEDEGNEAEAEAPDPENPESAEPHEAREDRQDEEVLYWYIIPLRDPGRDGMPQIAAWEATSKSGRATYFFRLIDSRQASVLKDPRETTAAVDRAVQGLNRALLMLNFRREPIYLSDDSLQMQPLYRRYAIACRKIPALGRLRSSFLGRALHISPQAWQQQVERLLSGI